MKKLLLSLLCIILTQLLIAQQDLSTPMLWHLGQHNALNPASTLDSSKITISLPNFAYQFKYTGASYNEVVETRNGERVADIASAIAQLNPLDNEVLADVSVETARFIYNTPKWSIQVHHATRFQSSLVYPKGLAQVAWQGNAAFIGETIEIGPAFDFLSYEELGIGGSLKFNKLTIGATINFLGGIGVATTENNSAKLHTDEDIYELTLTTDYEVLTADLDANKEQVDFGIFAIDFSDISLLSFAFPDFSVGLNKGLFNFGQSNNRGVSLDIGATYKLNDQWRFGFSVLDIGKIKWKNNINRYQSKETTTFSGVSLGAVNFNEGNVFTFDNLTDSLEQVINFTASSATFSTNLPTQAYFNAQYQVSSKLDLGLVLHGRFATTNTMAASIGGNYQISDFLRLGATYSVEDKEFYNLGLNASLHLGPVQIYAITNNILTAFRPLDANYQTARLGVNLIL